MKMLNPSYLAQVAGIGALVGAYTKLIGAMTSFAQQSIKTYSSFEKIQTGITTFFNDAQKGKSTFEDLRRLSNSTTFGVDELANSFTQLANSGVAVDSINDKLVMLGNIAGGSKEKFAELTSIYAKIASTGRAGAMQLQQLALRGVPIRKVLQEMGVQGVATADDITEAFKIMTAEGGQFYNAMGNILDTIEGKEGEVADFWKEFTVNFAEATGLAQLYKDALSLVRDALEKLADAFRKIGSDNVVFKTLFSTATIALIGTLTSVVGSGLVGAFIKLNSVLAKTAILKGILNPTALAVGLVTTAVIAGVVAYDKYAKAQREAKQASDEYFQSAKKQCEEVIELREKLEAGETLDLEGHLKINDAEIASITAKKRQLEAEIESARKKLNSTDNDEVTVAKNRLDLLENQVRLYDRQLERHQKINDSLQKRLEYLKPIRDLEEKYLKMQEQGYNRSQNVNKIISETLQSTDNYRINNIQNKIKDLQEELKRGYSVEKKTETNSSGQQKTRYVKNYHDEQKKSEIAEAISILNGELRKEFKPEKWAQYLGSLLGVDVRENSYRSIFGDAQRNFEKSAENIGTWGVEFEEEYWEDYADKAVDVISSVIRSGLFSKDSAISNEIVNYGITSLEKRAESFNGSVGSAEHRDNLLKEMETIKQMKDIDGENFDLIVLKTRYETEYLNSLDEEYRQSQLTTEELRKQQLIKAGMSSSYADEVISREYRNARMGSAQEKVDSAERALENAFTYNAQITLKSALAQAKLEKAIIQSRMTDEELIKIEIDRNTADRELLEAQKELAKATLEQGMVGAINGAVSGTDVGDFMQGAQNGGALVGLVNMLVGALGRALGSIEGISYCLSPITEMLKELAPIIKVFLIVFMIITPLFKMLGQAIMKFLDIITFGWFSKNADAYDNMIKEINGTADAMKDLREDMQKLSDAIAEQAEYYLKKKTELNSRTYVEGQGFKSVNDMIITPQGNFSTHPDDYIIASKNPATLGGGAGVVMLQTIIQNYAGSDTKAEVRTEQSGGLTKMFVMISKKVASDVATGENGWDSAMAQRESRIQGRRVSL